MARSFKRPDEAAMQRVFARTSGGAAEVVLRLARQALNSEGLALSLLDLRRDFILRQIEAHGWSYAAQISGVAAAALREEFLPRLRAANALPEAPKVGRDEREYLL